MAAFIESNMYFEFPDEDFYYIEKSPLFEQVSGFCSCECIVKLGDKVTLIEAKSSTPNPKNEKDFNEFINEIMMKFRDAMSLYNAVSLRHENELIGQNLRRIDLKTATYQMILIIYGHKEEWLPPVLDALKSKVRYILKVWNVKDTSVMVLNEKYAMNRSIIKGFKA